ncbi:MAG TPA: hypothetical protein VL588_08600, partial [Bdellovibrionota bacterium]|nr:hypothetical protein [Bdellovibrionota bacterium]
MKGHSMPRLLDLALTPEMYDSWEIETAQAREDVIRARLDEYVRHAKKNLPYWRDRLSAYDPKAEHPLLGVPAMGSDDLRPGLPPQGSDLVAHAGAAITYFQSGGTTGMPKSALFGNDEIEALAQPNARGFYALGLRADDRVANQFAVGGLYMTFIHINRMLQQYGCSNFPFANNTPVDFVHTVTKMFGINVFTGITSVVLSTLRGLTELGLDGINIQKVFYGGEHIYEADKEELRRKLGVELIAAPGYGTVDTWYIGYQCLKTPTGVFHAHDDQTFIEIVNEDTGRHCAPGEVGMLYATPFPRRVTPVVRYRVGDRAQWLPEACACGRTTPLFKLLGRGDDVLRIGYDSVDYAFIQEAVLAVPGLTGTVQMRKRREAGRDRLEISVETELPATI